MNADDTMRERARAFTSGGKHGRLDSLRLPRLVGRTLDAVVRTALPPVCAGCGVSGYWLCPICDQVVHRLSLNRVCMRCGALRSVVYACHRCADWSEALKRCRSAYLFDGPIREMIHRLKYQGEFARSEWCGAEIAQLVIETGWRPNMVVPVPLHRSRQRSRGYNQSAKIANVVAKALAIPTSEAIVRTRATISQVGLDSFQRRENVAGAFVCPRDLSDLSILLVDDVVTTGSTLDACASACRRAGAVDVRAVTLATGSTSLLVAPYD